MSAVRTIGYSVAGLFIGAMAGGVAGLIVGLGLAEIASVSTFEGYAAVFALYWALGGILAGMIAGVIVALKLARRRRSP